MGADTGCDHLSPQTSEAAQNMRDLGLKSSALTASKNSDDEHR